MARSINLRYLALFMVFAALAGSTYYWWDLLNKHEQLRSATLEHEAVHAKQLAEAQADHVDALLHGLDLALQQFRTAHQLGHTKTAAEIARSALATYPQGAIREFVIFDAAGDLQFSLQDWHKPVNVADREYFKFQQANQADRLFITKPMISRGGGNWITLMTRPILGRHGFAGVAVVALSPIYLSQKLAHIELAPTDVVTLFFKDGSFLARSLKPTEVLGTALPPDRPFLQPDAPAQGSFRTLSAADNIPRLFAWKKLASYPLIVTVGFDEQAILAPIEQQIVMVRRRAAIDNVLLLALIAAVALLLLRVEKQRQEAERSAVMLRSTLESTEDGILVVDDDDSIVAANRRFRELWQIPDEIVAAGKSEQIRKHVCDQLVDPGQFLNLIKDIYQDDTERRDILNFKDGRVFERYTRSFRLGAKRVRLWSFRDVSLREAAERATEQALHEAERLAQVRSSFLANMSHEIRTPLNGILGFAQIGQRQNFGRSSQKLFDQVLDSGQLLLGIINDVLDFSKIEAGKLNIEATAVQLERIVQHIKIMYSDRASAKGIALHVQVDDALPPWFRGDPLRISQILINLVGNAVKFTEHGEIILAVSRDSDHIMFRVSDTGIGMPPQHLARLYSPFEQADSSITRRFGGTGLGLAITRRLVDLMGGEIHANSKEGVGSTFVVSLPLEVVEAPAAASEIGTMQPHQQPASHPLAGLRILAAEDNPVNRMVLEDLLAMEGATQTIVADGSEAWELLQEQGEAVWDIVLTDIHMPVMGGHELAQRVRQFAPTLPVVGVTAHAMLEEQQQCLASGMVAHVAKPIVMDDLVAVILRHARRPAGLPGRTHALPDAALPAPTFHASAAATAEFDLEALLAKFQGRREFVQRLLRALLDSQGETPAKLRRAAEAHDLEDIAFVAHSLAGSSGNLGAASLSAAAKETEKLARAGDPQAGALAQELAERAERFLGEVKARVETRE